MAMACTGQHRAPVADPMQTFDAPDSAFEFGRHKRLPSDPSFDSVAAYRAAEREVLQLPVYSTALDAEVAVRAAELQADKVVLGRWQPPRPGQHRR
jgi:hypothetical protein